MDGSETFSPHRKALAYCSHQSIDDKQDILKLSFCTPLFLPLPRSNLLEALPCRHKPPTTTARIHTLALNPVSSRIVATPALNAPRYKNCAESGLEVTYRMSMTRNKFFFTGLGNQRDGKVGECQWRCGERILRKGGCAKAA